MEPRSLPNHGGHDGSSTRSNRAEEVGVCIIGREQTTNGLASRHFELDPSVLVVLAAGAV